MYWWEEHEELMYQIETGMLNFNIERLAENNRSSGSREVPHNRKKGKGFDYQKAYGGTVEGHQIQFLIRMARE